MPLDSSWEFAERLSPGRDVTFLKGGEKNWLPATVPGHVHLNLVNAGVIGDPFHRLNEIGCRWVDESDWTYRTTFTVTAERLASRGESGKHFLHFHGLDTLARVYLNGVLIGEAENFFLPYRFDVTAVLKEGDNALVVEFDSALRVGRERAKAYLGDGTSDRGSMGYFNFPPRAFIRKPQYMFGWDWGPELVSCGIWQKVELETVPVAEIVDCSYPVTPTFSGVENVTVRLTIRRYDSALRLRVKADIFDTNSGGNPAEAEVPTGHGDVTVELPMRLSGLEYWDVTGTGWGGGFAYELQLELVGDIDDAEETLEERTFPFGLRTVELIQEPDTDGQGTGFKFRVNGVDTYVKGANWIPDHTFPATITREQLGKRLQQVKDAGYNMLRVWGGGLYESDDFYNICDNLGILVWQDFGFACAMYPDDDPAFVENVRQEAIANIRRLRHHPCLALWCGGNENLELHQGRWEGATQATTFYGDRLIHHTLPTVLADEDPNTPYLPNSPYGGEPCTSEDHGDSHYWNVWHAKSPDSDGDWIHYAKSRTRFSSEFGFGSSCGLTAWKSCTDLADRTPRSPVVQWHDKTRKGYEKFLWYIEKHFPAIQTLDDLVYYGQANQALALQFGVEHWRRMKGRCWGTLFWQFNDCWPTQSWAVVDSAGEPKLAYYASKRFYAPVLLSLTTGESIGAHLVNDTQADVPGTVTLRLLTFDGEELARAESDATAPANAASGEIAALSFSDDLNRPDTFVHATFTDADGNVLAENFQLLDEPKNLRLPSPGLTWQVKPAEDDRSAKEITFTAPRFAAFVWLQFEGLQGLPTLSDNGFHLAPGQSRTVTVKDLPRGIANAVLFASLRVRTL